MLTLRGPRGLGGTTCRLQAVCSQHLALHGIKAKASGAAVARSMVQVFSLTAGGPSCAFVASSLYEPNVVHQRNSRIDVVLPVGPRGLQREDEAPW